MPSPWQDEPTEPGWYWVEEHTSYGPQFLCTKDGEWGSWHPYGCAERAIGSSVGFRVCRIDAPDRGFAEDMVLVGIPETEES